MDKNKNNWMRKEIQELLAKNGIINSNELVDSLAIKMIEYGRDCVLTTVSAYPLDSISELQIEKLDSELRTRIKECGGRPIEIKFGRQRLKG